MAAQLALDLPHRVSLDRDDFLVAPCNADAVAWIDTWPEWPRGLALYGAAACGKSHLAASWRACSKAVEIDAELLVVDKVPALIGEHTGVVVENVDRIVAGHSGREEALLHLYNLLGERDGTILLTGRVAPRRWNIELADIGSRVRALPAAEIGAPDDDLIACIIIKLFADRQLAIDDDVIAYLLPRMERSFDAAQRWVDRLDQAALANRRRVTAPLVRKLMLELTE